jgi:hypothetical protein
MEAELDNTATCDDRHAPAAIEGQTLGQKKEIKRKRFSGKNGQTNTNEINELQFSTGSCLYFPRP